MEMVRTFDQNHSYIGNQSREAVHRQGLWHETFHCWFVDEHYVYVQKRSAQKADFPSLFDITAAGHLAADETVEDGIREIEEELGIEVPFTALSKLATIQDVIQLPGFYDYEFAHVYMYHTTVQGADVTLQSEEVEGLYRLPREGFIQLCMNDIQEILCEHIDGTTSFYIGLQHFVPHETTYFTTLTKHLRT